MKKNIVYVVLTGTLIGVAGIVLLLLGNPGNMGFCMACFIRDTAGALKLHTAEVVQYARPEIMGFILGSFILSLATKEFRPRGGSSPLIRFVIGFFIMTSALVFLGCPLRMVLRMAGGDANAWIGLIGFLVGIWLGTLFLGRGFSLGRNFKQSALEGAVMPFVQIVVFILLITGSSLLAFSEKGPGSMRANVWIALLFALILGALAQRSRLCQMGGVRDFIMLRDPHLLWGGIAIFVAALILALATSKFNWGMIGQPIAHSQSLWNILGLAGVGFGSVLVGGCPMRQLVLTGAGNVDSAITVLGYFAGAAFAHNFKLASGPDVVENGVVTGGGTTPGGRVVAIVGLVVMLLIAFAYTATNRKKA